MSIPKIGNLKFRNRFFLAPMLEPNDVAFRTLCKKAGAGLTYTGMINPQSKQKVFLEDKPAMQIFCTSTKGLEEFIKKYDKQVCLWDFNLGCPSKLAKALGFGSFLHKRTEKIEEILKIMRESTKKPVTIKIRKSPESLRIIKIAGKYVDAVCIHPRTAEQGYSGEPDMAFALEVRKITKLPVIYSGNVNINNAKDLLDKFDFVMVGREAIGNPNIFAKLTGKRQVRKINFTDYLKLAQKYKFYFRTVKYQAMNFTKGMHNAKELRGNLSKTNTVEEIKEMFSPVL